MKQYLLSVCYPADGKAPSTESLQKIGREVAAVRREMQAAGVWVFSGGLQPSTNATVLRHRDDEVIVTDGPFIESKEMIGGITIIEVADLDAALIWAGKASLATGTPIEVRQFIG